jgi:type I restriction enzyme M protein
MWEAADALRGSMDAADSFEEHRARLEAERASGADPEDPEPFEEKMKRLTAQLREQTAEARRLDRAIAANLKHLGFPLDDK